jgi:hypothetical protein
MRSHINLKNQYINKRKMKDVKKKEGRRKKEEKRRKNEERKNEERKKEERRTKNEERSLGILNRKRSIFLDHSYGSEPMMFCMGVVDARISDLLSPLPCRLRICAAAKPIVRARRT